MVDKRLRVMVMTLNDMKAYYINFLFGLIGFPIFIAVTYFLWKVILENSTMTGITLGYLVSYYTLIYAVRSTTMQISVTRKISSDVREGRMVVILSRPMSYLSYTFWKRVLVFLFNLILYFLIIWGLSLFFNLKITNDLVFILMFLISLFFAFLMNFAMFFAVGMSAFWMEENWGFVGSFRTISSFLAGAWIPLELLSGTLKEIAFLLPFRYTAHFPVMVLQGNVPLSEIFINFGLIVFWTVVFFIIAKLAWKAGEKKFSGYGV